MDYQLYDIAPVLKPFVREICSMESDKPAAAATPIRVLPDTYVELFINLRQPQQITTSAGRIASLSRSFVTARMNQFMDVQTLAAVSFVSVCFSVGQAYRFFPLPMRAIANKAVDVQDFWGRSAIDMQQRIDETQTMEQRVQLIQHYLIRQLAKTEQDDPAVTYCIEQIRQVHGQLSLEALASQVGISNRQLIRRFNQCVGLSPKEFARITAFKQALAHLKNGSVYNLTQLAYESGYYDQAHFIHTCRDYSGLTPRQLLSANYILC